MQDDHGQLLWQLDESLAEIEQKLGEPGFTRVVSFDFFDTLLCRLCAEPSELFIEVGRRLAARGLFKQALAPVEFKSVRMAADDRARKLAAANKKSTEITLADIYAQLGAVVSDPASALEVEMEVERAFAFLNPSTASLAAHLRERGFKIALISDTYFTREQILSLMREIGLSPELFDALLLSNEAGSAKWDGGLFREAFVRFGIHASELVHIGDNFHADVLMPGQLGVNAVYYHRTTAAQDQAFETERSLAGHGTYPAASLNSLRTLAARLTTDERDPFRDGAFVFGPVLARYADWCVERFRAAGVSNVLALMREGELLGELIQRSAEAAGVRLNVVPCFVSRISTARAAMSAATPEQIEEQLEGNAGLTPQAVFDILGLTNEARNFLSDELLSKPMTSPAAIHGLVRELTSKSRIHDLVERKRAKSEALAFEYLDNLTRGESVIGVVDLGWSGSIQRNLSRILRHGGRNVRTIGCYVATTKRAGKLALEGDEAHAFLDPLWNQCTILPEVAITACVGSTDGYARDAAGQVVPVLGAFDITPQEVQLKQRIRDGIIAFQTLWLSVRASKSGAALTPDALADIDAHAGPILFRLLQFPDQREAKRLGGLTHDENFFGKRYNHALCDAESEATLRRSGAHELFANPTCYWPQGVVARVNPRLVSALSRRWDVPRALGRLGTFQTARAEASSFLDEELATLRDLLADFAPQQIIFAARESAAVESLLALLWRSEGDHANRTRNASQLVVNERREIASADTPHWTDDDAEPRLIFIGDEERARCNGHLSPWSMHLAGHPGSLDTLRAARQLLRPCARAALVLSEDIGVQAARAALNYLAPFLGPEGLVLIAHGRHDSSHPFAEHPLKQTVNEWFEQTGGHLGYDLWKKSEDREQHVFNWTLFVRGQTAVESEWHWNLNVADLPAPAVATNAGPEARR
jgi:FMN phosphatase YigB (HAD superfamily)